MCPWIPADFFSDFLEIWGQASGEEWELSIDLTSSGPTKEQFHQGLDPFTSGEAEAGILCAPTYLWGRETKPPRIHLAGWTPVFAEILKPQYHSVVLVQKDSPFRTLEDLREAKWAFNDPCSLSGYFSVTTSLGHDTSELVARALFTGGHMESLASLVAGDCDACAVDSNGWQIHRARGEWSTSLREVCKLGPFPTQPIVLSSTLSEGCQSSLKSSLQRCVNDKALWEPLQREYGLTRFVPCSDLDFKELAQKLAMPASCPSRPLDGGLHPV